MSRHILGAFIIVSVLNLASKVIPSVALDQFTKPLLMPILLFYVYRKSIGNTTLKTLLLSAALLFSWLGDVSLMYQSDELFFITGIGLFLVAQILYVIVLRKAAYQTTAIKPLNLLPFIVYGGIFFYILLPAGDFTAPIFVYGIVILTMAYSAYGRKGVTTDESFKMCFYGALLFVLSDSILAIHSFKSVVPYGGFFIMLTYVVAQYLLVEGVLRHVD